MRRKYFWRTLAIGVGTALLSVRPGLYSFEFNSVGQACRMSESSPILTLR